MLHAFFLAWLGVALAQISPGPNMMAVIAVALGQGRRHALLVALGIASGSLIWAAAVALGLGALFSTVPVTLTVLKIVGGLYLLFIAAKALRTLLTTSTPNVVPSLAPLSALGAWRRGTLVVLTNPKAALMWSAIATFLFGSGLGNLQVLAFGPVVAISALAIYGGYGLVFSTGTATRAYARFWRITEAVFGAAFAALGVTLLVSATGR
ncbi:MAG: LysE family translocator [Alphaproteobacteria bacterium]|nr:LysE family translocator [Alphaproteobacteria bacterium]